MMPFTWMGIIRLYDGYYLIKDGMYEIDCNITWESCQLHPKSVNCPGKVVKLNVERTRFSPKKQNTGRKKPQAEVPQQKLPHQFHLRNSLFGMIGESQPMDVL